MKSAGMNPMREEFVQNAVNFLKHPKVMSSSDIQRRAFLEKKGLTKDEIDEAFRGYLDTLSNGANVEDSNSHQGSDCNTASNSQENITSMDKMGGSVTETSAPASDDPKMPPHPKSYLEIIEMIQRGEMPLNIKEIDDSPPNPDQPLSKPRLAPRPKPWEASQQQQQLTEQQDAADGIEWESQSIANSDSLYSEEQRIIEQGDPLPGDSSKITDLVNSTGSSYADLVKVPPDDLSVDASASDVGAP